MTDIRLITGIYFMSAHEKRSADKKRPVTVKQENPLFLSEAMLLMLRGNVEKQRSRVVFIYFISFILSQVVLRLLSKLQLV